MSDGKSVKEGDLAAWQAVERHFGKLEESVRSASSADGRASALGNLLSYWDGLLQEPGQPHAMHVFRETHALLFEPLFQESVWSWLRDKAATITDLGLRASLWIGALEPLPERPVSWDALERLFCDWSLDPRTKWAVLDMYSSHPKLFLKHREHFIKKCKSDGRQPPGITEEDIRQWFFELSVPKLEKLQRESKDDTVRKAAAEALKNIYGLEPKP